MTVVLCGERVSARTTTQRDDGTKEYRRTWLVTTSSKHDGSKTVLGAAGLPKLFDRYQTSSEIDQYAYCLGREPTQIGPTQWEVEVRYDTRLTSQEIQAYSVNPQEWPPRVAVRARRRAHN